MVRYHSRMISTRIYFSLVLMVVGCGGDKDPDISSGVTDMSAGPTAMTATMGDDATGTLTSGASGTGEPTSDPSAGETGETPSSPHDVCQRYIACIAVT